MAGGRGGGATCPREAIFSPPHPAATLRGCGRRAARPLLGERGQPECVPPLHRGAVAGASRAVGPTLSGCSTGPVTLSGPSSGVALAGLGRTAVARRSPPLRGCPRSSPENRGLREVAGRRSAGPEAGCGAELGASFSVSAQSPTEGLSDEKAPQKRHTLLPAAPATDTKVIASPCGSPFPLHCGGFCSGEGFPSLRRYTRLFLRCGNRPSSTEKKSLSHILISFFFHQVELT